MRWLRAEDDAAALDETVDMVLAGPNGLEGASSSQEHSRCVQQCGMLALGIPAQRPQQRDHGFLAFLK